MIDTRNYYMQLTTLINNIDYNTLNQVAKALHEVWYRESSVWIAGNGGNHANSLHFTTDFTKGIFIQTGKSLKARSLGANPSLFSATYNDLPGDKIFAFQLEMDAKENDFAILMSAGGSSANIAEAAVVARKMGIKTLGLLGGLNPKLSGLFDYELSIKSELIQLVEDVHATIGHSLMLSLVSLIKENLGNIRD